MPILDPRYVSNWYRIQDNPALDATGQSSPQVRLYQTYTQSNKSDLKTVPLISGDIGPRVADVGGLTWTASASGPAVIFEDSFGNTGVASIFDTIITQFAVLQNPNYQKSAKYLMTTADIKVSSAGVTCTVGFLSDVPDPFITLPYERSSSYNFIGRVARNYDAAITISSFDPAMLPITSVFQVIDADLSIASTIDQKYFPGQGQSPYLSVQGYSVKGNVTVLAMPAEFANFNIDPQVPGTFVVKTNRSTVFQVGSSVLSLGAVSLTGSVDRSIVAGQITSVKMSFENLLGYNGAIV